MKRKRITESSTASVQPYAVSTTSSDDYGVFLNFRGTDIRYSFVDCLYMFLTAAGIRVFLDDEALRIGDDIRVGLRMAIDSSRLYMPIFSRNYASSKWCLMELAWMVKCARNSYGKGILPVFFDVEPKDVKLKTELYAKDLLRHEERFGSHKVRKWRKALRKVSKLKGWNLQSNQGQGNLISEITEHIGRRLKGKHRILPDHFTGMEEQTQEIIDALECGSRDVRFVVIYGTGGIGKTTLASVVFNKISWQFQECSFLSNVRESSAGNGMVNLQNKFLNDTRRFSHRNYYDANDAMNCLETSLRNKEVLVVLDDVSNMDQIRYLIGMGDWVGLGSRIIITTRDMSCIASIEEIEKNVEILRGMKIYAFHTRGLAFDSSLQLLCRHAFDEDLPPHGYEEVSLDILSFTRGVPLAVEVIGSYLRRKRVAIWKETLKKLKKVPHDRLYQELLMSSYEMLSDGTKEIFLDIACFFANHDKTAASYNWEAHGLYPETGIDTLVSYGLVKIDDSNKLRMHDIIRDLGREIVRQQSIEDLGRRSRLCNEEANHLLSRTAPSSTRKASADLPSSSKRSKQLSKKSIPNVSDPHPSLASKIKFKSHGTSSQPSLSLGKPTAQSPGRIKKISAKPSGESVSEPIKTRLSPSYLSKYFNGEPPASSATSLQPPLRESPEDASGNPLTGTVDSNEGLTATQSISSFSAILEVAVPAILEDVEPALVVEGILTLTTTEAPREPETCISPPLICGVERVVPHSSSASSSKKRPHYLYPSEVGENALKLAHLLRSESLSRENFFEMDTIIDRLEGQPIPLELGSACSLLKRDFWQSWDEYEEAYSHREAMSKHYQDFQDQSMLKAIAERNEQDMEVNKIQNELVAVDAEIARLQAKRDSLNEKLTNAHSLVEELTTKLVTDRRRHEEQRRQFVQPKSNTTRILIKDAACQFILEDIDRALSILQDCDL